MRLGLALSATALVLGCPPTTATVAEVAEPGITEANLGAAGNSSIPTTTDNPFKCVESNPRACLNVQVVVQGDFGGTCTTTALRRNNVVSHLQGIIKPGFVVGNMWWRHLDDAERRWLIEALGEAVTRQEEPSDCVASTTYTTQITWVCPDNDAGTAQRVVSFETNDCDEFTAVDGGSGGRRGYARALGVNQVMQELPKRVDRFEVLRGALLPRGLFYEPRAKKQDREAEHHGAARR